jgi:2-polyprenyl-6-methoxyphenol hydroxylase-like FAD-dependent oxidoreductase
MNFIIDTSSIYQELEAGLVGFALTRQSKLDTLPRTKTHMGETRAVVIGGSLAGMCAARVLSDFFDKVTVVERDAYPDGVEDRAGVPQGRGFHNLLIRGRREYESHFAGFEQLMLKRGAFESEFGVETAFLTPLGWLPPRRSFDMPMLRASRALIETTVRDLFRKLPKIEVIQSAEVVGLSVVRDHELRCAGVKVYRREGGGSLELEAGLVVDATGRGSKSVEFLKNAGVEPPVETVIEPFGGYACRWFSLRPNAAWPKHWWWTGGVFIYNLLETYALTRFENDRWMMFMGGFNGHYPPHEEEDFMTAIGRVGSPAIDQIVSLMEPVSPVYGNRNLTNRWRHYERWNSELRGFIAIADSACTFNPVFAQGMTVAAMAAAALRGILNDNGPATANFESKFFADQARIQREAWIQAVSTDLALPGTRGDRSAALRLFNWYRQCVILAALNPAVGRAFNEVQNLLAPVSTLFRPSIMLRAAIAKIVIESASFLGRPLIPPPTPMPPPMPSF